MKTRIEFLSVLFLSLVVLAGCSSLPKEPVQDSPTAKRTAILHETGSKHLRAGNYDKACLFFERALALHASVDDQPGVVRALTSLGRCRLAMGQVDQAEADFRKAFTSVQDLPHTQLKAQVLAGLGEIALHRQDPASARTWFEQGLELHLESPSLARAVLLHDLGAALLALEDLAAAEPLFEQALALNSALKNPLGIATNCYALALLSEKQGDLNQARQQAQRALNNDKKAENPPGIAQDLTLLGTLAMAVGNQERAADYYRRAKLVWLALGRAEKTAEINAKWAAAGFQDP